MAMGTAIPAPTILVVEDDQEICSLLGRFLGGIGYQIAAANDYAAGERILRENRPALLIADVGLRGGDGFDLAETARQIGVPVLLISGKPTIIERMKGGPIPFLRKPFRLADLEKKLAGLLAADQVVDPRAGREVAEKAMRQKRHG